MSASVQVEVQVQAQGQLEDSDFDDLDVCVDDMNRPRAMLSEEQRRARNRRRRDRRNKHSNLDESQTSSTPAPRSKPRKSLRPEQPATKAGGGECSPDNLLDMSERDVHRLRLREKLRGRINEERVSRMSSMAITAREEKKHGHDEGEDGGEDENEKLLSSLGSLSNLGGQKVSKRTLQRNIGRMPAAVRNARSKTMDQASWKGLSGQVGKALGEMMLQPTTNDASS